MKEIKKNRIFSLVVMGLMILSAFTIIGSLSVTGEVTKNVRAGGTLGKILFVYSNKTLADKWNDLLAGFGYNVNFLPYDHLTNADYGNYDLVIIGIDDTTIYLPESTTKILLHAHIPVLGIGYGAANYYTTVTGKPMYVYTPGVNSVAVQKNLSLYTVPRKVNINSGQVTLFTGSFNNVYVCKVGDVSSREALYVGMYTYNTAYASIAQFGDFMMFGYQKDPQYLTQDGVNLTYNLIYQMAKNHNYDIGIPRVINRINLDGQLGFFEWFGARFITLDSTNDNYTAMYEDENYLYVLMCFKNTSSTNEYMAVWFERDNNRTVGVDKSAFYIIADEIYGVNYKEVVSYNQWGNFNAPDGINITANYSLTLDHMIAEWRISKTYLNITVGSDDMMGFGIQYNSNSHLINYPSTFNWNDAETAATLYPLNRWLGQVEALNAKHWKPSVIDGDFSNQEWNGATSYGMPAPVGNYTLICVSHDRNYLYIGGYTANVSGQSSLIYLFFDTEANGGSAPQTDDFEIWGGKNGADDSFYSYEHYGTGTAWDASHAITNGSMEFKLNGNNMEYEIKLKLSKLGIAYGTYKEIKMQITLKIGGNTYNIPTNGEFTVPDTWNLTLYSQSLWGNGTMNYDARNGTQVTVDGVFSSGEWDDAFSYHFPTHFGYSLNVFMKTDTHNEKLLIGMSFYNPIDSNSTYFEMGFDVGYDHDGPVRSGDVVIGVTYWGHPFEYAGNGGSWDIVTPSGWIFASNNSTTTWTLEIEINYSKLGIIPGVDSKLGFIVAIINGGGYEVGPQEGTFYDTTTWNTITTSDNWGQLVIPEFDTVLFIPIMGIVLALVAWRKKR